MIGLERSQKNGNLLLSEKNQAALDRRFSNLKIMITSREADRREDILFRQGRGQFHVSSSGHEPIHLLADLIEGDDHIYCHYRDRALMLALGIPLYETALGFFAKADSSSGGRQLVNHFSHKRFNVMSSATPTGLQCLPAAGSAWAFKLKNKRNLAICCLGDASTRQGEFFEALAFAIQENLPLIFVIEDNGYGISTSTETLNPVRLGIIPQDRLVIMNGHDLQNLQLQLGVLFDDVRSGKGPKVAWIKLDRLAPHTASDDHSKYRTADELAKIQLRDPIHLEKEFLVDAGVLTNEEFEQISAQIRAEVKTIYEQAEQAADPDPSAIGKDVFAKVTAKLVKPVPPFSYSEPQWTMATAWNHALNHLLKEMPQTILFGEDIADPKGGVFGLTKGLSTCYPDRVFNSPLAEATIVGLASGLAMGNFLPIFELQFADFVGPAFNQIVNQIATLRWRSKGEFQCPMVLYAPCGSYIANGGPWHSQTNEGWFAHAPGLKVCMPSNANDAANALYAAATGQDPVVILLPKNQFQVSSAYDRECNAFSERARILKAGDHVTIAAWGNCVNLSMQTAEVLQHQNIHCEIVDLLSIVPCDWETLHRSVQKTGRLVVVQEDNKTCSFGQAIISEICSKRETWENLYSPPQLVSRPDVHIGFNRILEQSVLPQVENIIDAANIVLGRRHG